jgi:hypothetical protein
MLEVLGLMKTPEGEEAEPDVDPEISQVLLKSEGLRCHFMAAASDLLPSVCPN